MAKEKTKGTSFEDKIAELESSYGKGVVVGFNESSHDINEGFSTGSIGFDHAIGGKWLLGRMYELMGWEGSGKTTICGHAIAECQKEFPDKKVVYIDAEHALDKLYFSNIGVDINKMYIAQPSNGEEGFNIAEKLISSGEVALLIIDSDTSMKPKKEIEGEVGDSSMGLKARLNGQAYPKIHNLIRKGKTCVIVISQFREKIGVMFGSPETTSGGHALKFYADVRMEVRKSLAKDGEEVYGNVTKIKVIKSKVCKPFETAKFEILFGTGIDKVGEVIDLGIEKGIIKKWGGIITYNENKFTVDEFKKLLIPDSDFYNEIKSLILNS